MDGVRGHGPAWVHIPGFTSGWTGDVHEWSSLYGCMACMRIFTGYRTGSQCHSEEDCPALVPVDNGACAKTPLLSALPGCVPGTWVKTMPGGHVTPD